MEKSIKSARGLKFKGIKTRSPETWGLKRSGLKRFRGVEKEAVKRYRQVCRWQTNSSRSPEERKCRISFSVSRRRGTLVYLARSAASVLGKTHADATNEGNEVEEEEEASGVQRQNCRNTAGTPKLGDPQTAGHSVPQRPSIRHQ